MWPGHDESHRCPCSADHRARASRCGYIPSRKRAEGHRIFSRHKPPRQRDKELAAGVFRRQINCSAWPCEWWKAPPLPLVKSGRAHDQQTFAAWPGTLSKSLPEFGKPRGAAQCHSTPGSITSAGFTRMARNAPTNKIAALKSWAPELERLRERDAEFLNGDVIQNVRHGDAGHSRDDKDQIDNPTHLARRGDISKGPGKRKKQSGSDETDHAKASDRTEFGGWAFHQRAVEGPAKRCRKGNEHSAKGDVTGGHSRLEPENSDRAEQAQEGTQLKLPLPQNVTFFGKHD